MGGDLQGKFSPLENRYFLFDFFKQPKDDELFQNFWKGGCEYVKKFDAFRAAHLLHSKQPHNEFPWVNFVVSESLNAPFFGMPDEVWMDRMRQAIEHEFEVELAGYREIASFRDFPLIAEDYERPAPTRFLVTCVRVQDDISNDTLEQNWKEWTGANFIHGHVEDKILVDTHLYKAFKTVMEPMFRYVLTTEINDMTEDSGNEIAEFINKRGSVQEGVDTFTGFYKPAITVRK